MARKREEALQYPNPEGLPIIHFNLALPELKL